MYLRRDLSRTSKLQKGTVSIDYVSQYPNNKEEMMKRLIHVIIVAFIFMLLFIGCFATMTPEQRKETYDMRTSVGNSPFVGDANSPNARDLAWYQMNL